MQMQCYGFLKQEFVLNKAPVGHKYKSDVDFFKNVLRDLDVTKMFKAYLSAEEIAILPLDDE